MACLARVEALFEHHSEAGMQRVDHRDRRGVVVRTRSASSDVLGDHVEIEIPRLGRFEQLGERSVGDGEWGEPGRYADTLLRAAVGDVDAPVVDTQIDTGE